MIKKNNIEKARELIEKGEKTGTINKSEALKEAIRQAHASIINPPLNYWASIKTIQLLLKAGATISEEDKELGLLHQIAMFSFMNLVNRHQLNPNSALLANEDDNIKVLLSIMEDKTFYYKIIKDYCESIKNGIKKNNRRHVIVRSTQRSKDR